MFYHIYTTKLQTSHSSDTTIFVWHQIPAYFLLPAFQFKMKNHKNRGEKIMIVNTIIPG